MYAFSGEVWYVITLFTFLNLTPDYHVPCEKELQAFCKSTFAEPVWKPFRCNLNLQQPWQECAHVWRSGCLDVWSRWQRGGWNQWGRSSGWWSPVRSHPRWCWPSPGETRRGGKFSGRFTLQALKHKHGASFLRSLTAASSRWLSWEWKGYEYDEARRERRETYCKANHSQISVIKCTGAVKHIQRLTHHTHRADNMPTLMKKTWMQVRINERDDSNHIINDSSLLSAPLHQMNWSITRTHNVVGEWTWRPFTMTT